MSTQFLINVAIEVFCSIMCLVIITCIIIGENPKSRLNRAFILLLVFNIAAMLSNALVFYSIGKLQSYYFALNYIGNFFNYVFNYALIMCFSNYIYIYIAEKTSIKRTVVQIIYVICGVGIALTALSLLTNMFYIIDENNFYHRQSLYWLSQVLALAAVLINSIVIIKNRKHFTRMETIALSIYIALPVIGIAIELLIYGYVPLYISSTLIIMFIFIGMQAELSKAAKEKELQLTRSRVAVMLSQIQPHFLYNSLASISHLCDEDPERAKKVTQEFSDYLRANMSSLEDTQPIPFEQELKHVKCFLSLKKAMLGDALTVNYDIRENDFKLPSLTVQPIVENAVRHGIEKRAGGGKITITTCEEDNNYLVIVSDNGVGFNIKLLENSEQTHIGIKNVRQRLLDQCNGTMAIISKKGIGSTVTIAIPKHSSEIKVE